ncbi:MAG TPA: hypothetical protein VIU81_08075 [Gaiellaceae bacterium]
MRRRRVLLVLLVAVLTLGGPAVASAASPTVRLLIVHVVRNCHVWSTSAKTLGPSARLKVPRGGRVMIRANCPMDFDFRQTQGPRLALGDPRTYAGGVRTLIFKKAGVYRLIVTNVQTPEERGLVTLGDANTLSLTVVVK